MNNKKIPESTISRLFVYLREVTNLARMNIRTISSSELGERLSLSDVQVRKDLGYFGSFGVSGAGYNTQELKDVLTNILGKHKSWNVCVVGAGFLGSALVSYAGFANSGINIVACFDKDTQKTGRSVAGLVIQHIDSLPEEVKRKNISIGIIAVPAAGAQEVCDLLVSSGVECIMNFAPANLNVPENIKVKYVDLATELGTLSYFLANKNGK